jgi:hypothetical protein
VNYKKEEKGMQQQTRRQMSKMKPSVHEDIWPEKVKITWKNKITAQIGNGNCRISIFSFSI